MNKEIVSVWGYLGILEKPSIEIYEQWDVFLKSLDRDQGISDDLIQEYLAILEDNGIVTFFRDSKEIPQEKDTHYYFDWFFQLLKPIRQRFPAAENIRRTKECFDKENQAVSSRDLEFYASGYLSPMMVGAEFDFDIYLHWLFDPRAGTMEDKQISLFKSWLSAQEKYAIEQQGFAVRNVFSDDPSDKWKRYSYTKGLSDKHRFEVLAVNAGGSSGNLLADAVKLLLEKKLVPNVPGQMDDFLVNDEPLRVKVVELQPTSKTCMLIRGFVDEVDKIYQVYIGDQSNKLPGETGYNEDFLQTMDLSD